MFENRGRGIGKKGKDNGLLVVVAVDDREVRVEVGYELEQFITDGFAGQIIRHEMMPLFRQSQYGEGLVAGVTRLINRIAEGRGVELQNVPRTASRSGAARVGRLLLVLFVAFHRAVEPAAARPAAAAGAARRGAPGTAASVRSAARAAAGSGGLAVVASAAGSAGDLAASAAAASGGGGGGGSW